ncbi:PepSY-associated TM helix domain-containing protein [Pseudocolwellia sp. AS88]|uniref:PepSY-associated TM helix domain-containing protein n=1 Tax=Pseudocolwellia TaxID=2848177 RepID=UPI0026EF086A|nr:PepSY-associated TM helix domain-containing protein [Pseudocolwellia sp. AS88]MDO7086658.1 PepSY-associated TM helix domain-containing protein [Pseudocolwellia sp. AS88]
MSFRKVNRSTHKWASIIVAIPVLIIIVTGILLLVKKEFSYLQPASQSGVSNVPSISFDVILEQAKSVEEAQVDSWDSIDRLDVRPSKGIIKIRTNSQWEIQLDSETAEILHVAYRRSDTIEQIHDGTYWQKNANLWLSLPVAITLLLISLTGLFLFFYPYYKRFQKRD